MKPPLIIGHRANSWRIAELYRRLKVEAVEVDVTPSEAGEPLVLHGPSEVRRPSPLGRLFAALDYKLFYRDPLLNPRPLAEWLGKLTWAKTVMLDLKSGVDPEELRDSVRRSGFNGALLVSGHDHRLVLEAAELLGAKAYASFATRIIGLPDYALHHGFQGISIKHTLLDPGLARELERRGLGIIAWTVNERRRAAELACMGVEAFVSDAPWGLRGVSCFA